METTFWFDGLRRATLTYEVPLSPRRFVFRLFVALLCLAAPPICSRAQGQDERTLLVESVGGDGLGLRALTGTQSAQKPALSPDGRNLAFAVTVKP